MRSWLLVTAVKMPLKIAAVSTTKKRSAPVNCGQKTNEVCTESAQSLQSILHTPGRHSAPPAAISLLGWGKMGKKNQTHSVPRH